MGRHRHGVTERNHVEWCQDHSTFTQAKRPDYHWERYGHSFQGKVIKTGDVIFSDSFCCFSPLLASPLLQHRLPRPKNKWVRTNKEEILASPHLFIFLCGCCHIINCTKVHSFGKLKYATLFDLFRHLFGSRNTPTSLLLHLREVE